MTKPLMLTCPSLCRFTGRIIKDVINLGSYNFLGLAARYDESMRTVKDVLEAYGVGVASTRHEMGMYVHYFEILSSWVSASLWCFLLSRSYLDCVPQKAVIKCKKEKLYESLFKKFQVIYFFNFLKSSLNLLG